LRGIPLRLIAILLLLSGVADYVAFDVGDQRAPMSAAGKYSLIDPGIEDDLSHTTIGHTDSHDDGCIGCAAAVTADRLKLVVSELIETTTRVDILPPSDPQLVRVDPPPRA
jgi:hypothetical protein